MREISFRGKALQGGEWVFGDYMRYAGGAQIWMHDPDGGTHNVLVDPATVGQYTGLTDKYGAKIFEGDVLALKDDYGGKIYKIIRWRDEWAAFGTEDTKTGYRESMREWEKHRGWWAVAGNVHDNPELLEGGTAQ